jgi:hypothetical protein
LSDEEKMLCDIDARLEGPLDSATDSLFQKVGTFKITFENDKLIATIDLGYTLVNA